MWWSPEVSSLFAWDYIFFILISDYFYAELLLKKRTRAKHWYSILLVPRQKKNILRRNPVVICSLLGTRGGCYFIIHLPPFRCQMRTSGDEGWNRNRESQFRVRGKYRRFFHITDAGPNLLFFYFFHVLQFILTTCCSRETFNIKLNFSE